MSGERLPVFIYQDIIHRVSLKKLDLIIKEMKAKGMLPKAKFAPQDLQRVQEALTDEVKGFSRILRLLKGTTFYTEDVQELLNTQGATNEQRFSLEELEKIRQKVEKVYDNLELLLADADPAILRSVASPRIEKKRS